MEILKTNTTVDTVLKENDKFLSNILMRINQRRRSSFSTHTQATQNESISVSSSYNKINENEEYCGLMKKTTHFFSPKTPKNLISLNLSESKEKELNNKNEEILVTITLEDDLDLTISESNLEECLVCFEKNLCVVFSCGHKLCGYCKKAWKRKSKNCPVCRKQVF